MRAELLAVFLSFIQALSPLAPALAADPPPLAQSIAAAQKALTEESEALLGLGGRGVLGVAETLDAGAAALKDLRQAVKESPHLRERIEQVMKGRLDL